MSLNNRGFTFIEVFVSMIILSVGLLGVLQAVSVAMDHNMQTKLRNEAVIVADNVMRDELAKGFNNVSTTANTRSVSRKVMLALKNYSVVRSGSTAQNSKRVTYEVKWSHKGMHYNHLISSVVSGANP